MPGAVNASGAFSTAAASVTGKLIRKLNTAADCLSKPSNSPPVIVEPDRETPGRSAKHWMSPIVNASRGRIDSSGRSRRA